MKRREFQHLLASMGVLRHPCDLDLLLFFCRHPRALLPSDRLATCVGYDLNQVTRSLDRLTEAGLLERSRNPTHAARMYVLNTPESGWVESLLEIASTHEGRRSLIEALQDAASPDESEEKAPSAKDERSRVAHNRNTSR